MKGRVPIRLAVLAALSVLAVLAAEGCANPAPEPAARPTPLPTARPVLRKAFVAPADGRLTADHVRTYLEVRRRAAGLAREAKGASADLASALVAGAAVELQAAAELGYEAAEYRWVRERVAEALAAGTAGPEGGEAAALLLAAEASKASQGLLGEPPSAGADRTAGVDVQARDWNRKVIEPFRTELTSLSAS